MSTVRRITGTRGFLAGLSVAFAFAWMLGGPSASGYPNAEAEKFEYTAVSVDSNALQAKLTELGGQGWEIVVITTSEARVDGANNPPKVITEKYDVVGKRPLAR